MQRLAELRKIRKLTQDQLSKKLHVDQTTISAYENGRGQPDIDKLRQLCKILHVSADYLIGLSDFINPEVDSPNYIPVYRSLIDGFGQGKPLCYESIPMSLITKERSFLGMQISDDHMLPLYLPGDIILIDKSAPLTAVCMFYLPLSRTVKRKTSCGGITVHRPALSCRLPIPILNHCALVMRTAKSTVYPLLDRCFRSSGVPSCRIDVRTAIRYPVSPRLPFVKGRKKNADYCKFTLDF